MTDTEEPTKVNTPNKKSDEEQIIPLIPTPGDPPQTPPESLMRPIKKSLGSGDNNN